MTMCALMVIVIIWPAVVEGRKLVDLTHTLDSKAPKWPLTGILSEEQYFQKKDLLWARTEHYWAAISYMEYYEHMGTHIDAPIHTAEGRSTVDQIPVDKLMGPGVVIDIKDKAKKDPDYGLTVSDIEEYEDEFGRIPDGAIVILNSGWGLKFPRPESMFGTNSTNDSATFHFPGFTIEAAEFLLTKRSLRVLGTDTPSLDKGADITLPVHVYLQSHEIPLVEYIANLDTIPQAGTIIFLGAPKFKGGTGGPTRVIAVVGDENFTSGADYNKHITFVLITSCMSCIFAGIL